jgi:hypothetical protein
VHCPVDFGDLTEDGFEEIVEHDLAIELDHEIVDRSAIVEVATEVDGRRFVNDESRHAAPFL